MTKQIYLDHAATTPIEDEVLEVMEPYFNKKYGNASSLHSKGRTAKKTLDNARKKFASELNADFKEIIFTSGGTESDNMAIKGIVGKKDHVITSKIEHHAVLHACKDSKAEVTKLNVDKNGFADLEDLKNKIKENTKLVSIMHANNEIGTIQDIKKIGKTCKENNILFHTDAVQSFGKLNIDVKKMNIDLLSASAHKIYGPKGIGLLYKNRDVKLNPLISGGGHEFGVRSGTENIPGIVGFSKALELSKKEDKEKIKKLRNYLIDELLKIENSKLNGPKDKRLYNNVNVIFKYIEGEALILKLDDDGICASTGSACSTKSLEPSHVLTSIGLRKQDAHGSLRLTLGRHNTKKEIDYTVKKIKKRVKELRKISPLTK